MRKISLSIVFLLALACSGLAQNPCRLTADNVTSLRGLRIGSTLEAVRKDFKLEISFSGDGKRNWVRIDDVDIWLHFEKDRLTFINARYPKGIYPDISQFTASLTSALNLPDAWVLPTAEQIEAAKRQFKLRFEIADVEDTIRIVVNEHGSEYARVKELKAELAVLKKDQVKTNALANGAATMKCTDFSLQASISPWTDMPVLHIRLTKP